MSRLLDSTGLRGRSSRMAIDIEQGSDLAPRYGPDGLVTAVVTDASDGTLLMVAHMNADALAATLSGGEAVFWSRSRQALWRKGETSGHVLKVREVRVDCDQDAVQLIVDPAGPACHTLARSCFYRRVTPEGGLERVDP